MRQKNIKRRLSHFFKGLSSQAAAVTQKFNTRRRRSTISEIRTKTSSPSPKKIVTKNQENVKKKEYYDDELKPKVEVDTKFNDYNFWKCEYQVDISDIVNADENQATKELQRTSEQLENHASNDIIVDPNTFPSIEFQKTHLKIMGITPLCEKNRNYPMLRY